MPDLLLVEYLDEPGDLDDWEVRARLGGGWGDMEGWDADDEDENDEESDSSESSESEEENTHVRGQSAFPRPTHAGRYVRRALSSMFASRYEAARNTLPRGPGFLPHVLHRYKHERPDLFRQQLRVNPYTFDRLVARLVDDPVFSNNSENAQMSVEEQVAITLYWFGHFGNGAGLQEVANWAGCGKGTVDLVTRRVMTAVLRPEFLAETIRHPTAEEKEKAKAWVEAHSCKAWRNGWCMVDGTLIPLDEWPYWYGESYFDRKCNYSLNIQVRASVDLYGRRSDSCRSSLCPTYASSTSATVTRVAPTIQPHGARHLFMRIMTPCWRMASLYGPTRPIQFVYRACNHHNSTDTYI